MISSTAAHDGDFVDAGEVQYLYDGNGRRIQKIFAGTATADQDVYFNEDFQALETRWNGSSNAYEQHVWDLKYIDAPILRYRDANGHTSSTATGDGTSEEVLYFTFDANFNITGLVQENQTFVERYVYTPYGDRLVLTGTFGSRGTTSYDQQLGHQGLYTDTESGTIYNRGRQGYHPGLGNFTQRDPRLTEYQDGPNLYQGYRGNPVIYTDWSGLDAASTQPATQPSTTAPKFELVPIKDSGFKFPPHAKNIGRVWAQVIGDDKYMEGQFAWANRLTCACNESIVQQISNWTKYYDKDGKDITSNLRDEFVAKPRSYIEAFQVADGRTMRPDIHIASRRHLRGLIDKVHYHVEIISGCGTYDGKIVNNKDHYEKWEPGDPGKVKYSGETIKITVDFEIWADRSYRLQIPIAEIDQRG